MTLAALLLCALAFPPQDLEAGPYDEPLVLPHVLTGLADEGTSRVVLNLRADGRVTAGGRVLHDPEEVEGQGLAEALARWLAGAAERADELPLLLRPDLNAPYATLHATLAACSALGVAVDLAVGDARHPKLDEVVGLAPRTDAQQRLPLGLPLDGAEPAGDAAQRVAVRVLAAGRKLDVDRREDRPWSGEPGTRFRFERGTRSTEFALAGKRLEGFEVFRRALNGMAPQVKGRPFTIEVGAGVTVAEVVAVLDAARSLGASEVRLAGVGAWR